MTNETNLARDYLQALKDGRMPQERPDFGVYEAAILAVERLAFKSRMDTKKIGEAISILAKDKALWAIVPEEMIKAPIMPELPADVALDAALAGSVCGWFADVVEYIGKWSPRSAPAHRTASALWILSTVAARRVCAAYGGRAYPSLYIVLSAPSSVYGKTTTAKIAQRILDSAELSFLLGSNSVTPEKLLSNMAGQHVPSNWQDMSIDQQQETLQQLAFSGQIGWYYSEIGQFFREANDPKSRNAALKSIVLRMDDSEKFIYDTRSHGRETINKPYLSIYGTTTPADLKPHAAPDSPAWLDGLFARFLFASPEFGEQKTMEDLRAQRFPAGDDAIPARIIQELRAWHERLGVPRASLSAESEKPSAKLLLQCDDLPEQVLQLTASARNALDDYGDALDMLAQNPRLQRLQASYSRLRDKCLRIATLVASFEDAQQIGVEHIAFAQQLTEEARLSLHQLDLFLNASSAINQHDTLTNGIVEYLKKTGVARTASEIRVSSYEWRHKYSAEDFRNILDGMVKDGLIKKNSDRKVPAYEPA